MAAFGSDDGGRRLRLTAVPSGSTILEVEIPWPTWKDLDGDFEGIITVRGADPTNVFRIHAYDHIAREWNPASATADHS